MPATKIIYYPAPATPLTREEIEHIFARFDPSDEIMVALRQILAERLAYATADSTEPRLNERFAGIVAGRIHEIASLQQELTAFHATAAHLRQQRLVEKVRPK